MFTYIRFYSLHILEQDTVNSPSTDLILRTEIRLRSTHPFLDAPHRTRSLVTYPLDRADQALREPILPWRALM